jgi:hypothetical protein
MRRRALPFTLAILLAISLAPTASADSPYLDITIDRFGSVSQSEGLASVRGTVICMTGSPLGLVTADVGISQKLGRSVIEGYAVIVLVCDGTPQTWDASGILSNRVDDEGNGLFKPGPAEAYVYAFGWSGTGDDEVLVSRVIRVRPSRDGPRPGRPAALSPLAFRG